MRPERLRLLGFTAFRDEVELEFGDAEVFAFTGPTGSGKSSLIDAIVFALYGSVPRFADKRAVAPVISLGRLEARVRFDFSLGDTPYAAVRVVRRTRSGGASTEEARLERQGEVIAGTADEVTEAVTELLGLGYEQFTKAVVLPQGEFARFLHDKPRERQALLRSLLDIEVYGRVRELASREAAAAAERVRILEARLGELESVSVDAKIEAQRQVAALEALGEQVEAGEARLDAHLAAVAAAEEVVRRGTDWIESLRLLAPRPDLPELVASARETQDRVHVCEEALQAASSAVGETEERRRALGDPEPLLALKASWEALEEAREARGRLGPELAAATSEVEDRRAELVAAATGLDEARRSLEGTARVHAAHDLASRIEVGTSCPVCGRVVSVLPDLEPPEDLHSATAEVRRAEATHGQAEEAIADSRGRLARIEGRAAQLEETIGELGVRLEGRQAADEVLRTLASMSQAEVEERAARSTREAVQRTLAEAREQLEAVQGRVSQAWREFDRARDSIADLDPPIPDRQDPASDWAQLGLWATARLKTLEAEVAGARQQAEAEGLAASALTAELDRLLSRHHVSPAPSRAKAVFEALTTARHRLHRLEEELAEADRLRRDLDQHATKQSVAEALQTQLRADRFEAWLLDEALDTLVAGANHLLRDLSAGAYSLWLAGRQFQIVDHRNADERRPVRTLSGGETFLVSLALALSLAEQLTVMSVQGGARIETIFLDEGFGTLDRETLEVVGAVIHELGARGRSVGVVTHVAELAEQIPVRFEVSRGPTTAAVTRVER